MEFDANPENGMSIKQLAVKNEEVFNAFLHKINEKEYYKNLLNKEYWNFTKKKELTDEKAEQRLAEFEKLNVDFETLFEKKTPVFGDNYNKIVNKI